MAAMAMGLVNGIVYKGGQRYASMNWCYHFLQGLVEGCPNNLNSPIGTSLVQNLKHFMSQSYSFWINTLILEGWIGIIKDLDTMLSVLKVSLHYPQDLGAVLQKIRSNTEVISCISC